MRWVNDPNSTVSYSFGYCITQAGNISLCAPYSTINGSFLVSWLSFLIHFKIIRTTTERGENALFMTELYNAAEAFQSQFKAQLYASIDVLNKLQANIYAKQCAFNEILNSISTSTGNCPKYLRSIDEKDLCTL